MERYMVAAEFFGWDEGIEFFHWEVDEPTFGEAREQIQRIIDYVNKKARYHKTCFHVYELGNEVTDKFLNNKDK